MPKPESNPHIRLYSDEAWRAQARGEYASDDIEIEDDAKVSESDEGEGVMGAWVQAWVWVSAGKIETQT